MKKNQNDMLPNNLLRVKRTFGNKIQPRLVTINSENINMVTNLTHIFKNNIKLQKSELNKKINNFELQSSDFKLVRGLATILERYCAFTISSSLDPLMVRRRTFELAMTQQQIGVSNRPIIIQQVSKELNTTPDQIENALYADLDENLILKTFNYTKTPKELLKEYNISLTQTLLFNATKIDINTKDNLRKIYNKIKYLGLIYQSKDNGHHITVDGPASIFKFSQKYGVKMAKLLPIILTCKEWKIEATILDNNSKTRHMFLDQNSGLTLYQSTNEEEFDSLTEQDFATKFTSLKTNWILKREPDIITIDNGKTVFVPDFAFCWYDEKGFKVMFEIVGFWTHDYIEQKLNKINKLPDNIRMILAINKHLNISTSKIKSKNISEHTFYYNKKIQLEKIMEQLKAYKDKAIENEIKRLKQQKIILTQNIINIKTLAKNLHVTPIALTNHLQNFDKYKQIGNTLIRKTYISTINNKISENMTLSEAINILNAHHINEEDHGLLLNYLNYKIQWNGLDSDKSKIILT